jgi:hypothetical protein
MAFSMQRRRGAGKTLRPRVPVFSAPLRFCVKKKVTTQTDLVKLEGPSVLFAWNSGKQRNITVMSRKKLRIPPFRNEGQEADWWDKNRSDVEADLRAGTRQGKMASLQAILEAHGKRPTAVPLLQKTE